MGSGNVSVPLQLPSGRNGFQPGLSLDYSTGNPNGPFGLGWSLSVPSIARLTARGVPGYPTDDLEPFLLTGAGELVATAPSGDRVVHRPRVERSFASIAHVRRADTDHWEVRALSGRSEEYGTLGARGADSATVGAPDGRIFAWQLTAIADPFGNRIEYEWERDGAQSYLRSVRYIDFTDAQGERQFLVTVELTYESRPDAFTDRRAGFVVRTARRCREIAVRTHAGTDRLLRTYTPTYVRAAGNGASLLSAMTVRGHDGSAVEALPPLALGYTAFDPSRRDLRQVGGANLPASSLGDPRLALVDLLGRGLPDIVELGEVARYWRNRGQGRFDPPRRLRSVPAGVRLDDPGVRLLDEDGDGAADVLVARDDLAAAYPLAADATGPVSPRPQRAPPVALEDPEIVLADLTGDGITDALRFGSPLEAVVREGTGRWSRTRRVATAADGALGRLDAADPAVRVADMTGDGLPDIVLLEPGAVRYWPSFGTGRFDAPLRMRNGPRLPASADPRRLLLGDVDGDGASDLVHIGDGEVTIWINQAGERWSAPVTIAGTPSLDDLEDVRLADLDGTGVAGVLWSADAGATTQAGMFFLDVIGGRKPYLLDAIDNGMGATTAVQYAPSTRFRLEDERDRVTRWRVPLPFPIHAVARVEVRDAISGSSLVSEYRYRDGGWDGEDRVFAGFARVDRRDVAGLAPALGVPAPPPLLTRSWFHLGPEDDVGTSAGTWSGDPPSLAPWPGLPGLAAGLDARARRDARRCLRGRLRRTETYVEDGTERAGSPVEVAEHLHVPASLPLEGVAVAADAEWRSRVFAPLAVAERATRWERGDDPRERIVMRDGFDAFGQPRHETDAALPRRGARRRTVVGAVVGAVAADDPRAQIVHTRTTRATPDPGLYLHDRVAEVVRIEPDPPLELTTLDTGLAGVRAGWRAAVAGEHARLGGALASWTPAGALATGVRLTGHAIVHYDGSAFEGRAVGAVGPYGAVVRREELAFTTSELDAAYGSRRPSYLGGSASQPAGAPAGFGTTAGYRRLTGLMAADDRWYVDAERRRLDVHVAGVPARGLPLVVRDPVGVERSFTPDEWWLDAETVIDAVGLETRIERDPRTLAPARVTDPNGHRLTYRWTPLGMVAGVIRTGANGQGGTAQRPEIDYTYDFLAYIRTRDGPNPQPVSSHTRRRVWHAADAIGDELIETRTFSDGLGSVVQTRATAEPRAVASLGLPPSASEAATPARIDGVTDRVVRTTTATDRGARVVSEWEPAFATGWDYEPATTGARTRRSHDALGRLVREVAPDGTESRVIFGTPLDPTDPSVFSPTPWEVTEYDGNDLAPLSTGPGGENLAGRADVGHHHTPRLRVLDALDRTTCEIHRNGTPPAPEDHVIRQRSDARGNVVDVIDAHGRIAAARVHDLLGRMMRETTLDAGARMTVYDAAGKPIETRDARDATTLRQYDARGRLTQIRARDRAADSLTQREALRYGDEADRVDARARNALGRLVEHRDEAGIVRITRYDFKGPVLERTRRPVSATAIAGGWVADWERAGADSALSGDSLTTTTVYDALEREVAATSFPDAGGVAHVLRTSYSPRGAPTRIELDGGTVLSDAAYDARGRRILTVLGNDSAATVVARAAYDPMSGRLRRVRAERATLSPGPAGLTITGVGDPIQDTTYVSDLAGNVTAIEERSPGAGVAVGDRDRLRRTFAYDPRYRLLRAGGRACIDAAQCAQATAPDQTELYTERYRHDPAGNLLSIERDAGVMTSWTRAFGLGGQPPAAWAAAGDDRTTSVVQGATTHTLGFNAAGQLDRLNTERRLTWDHAARLVLFEIRPAGAAAPSVQERFLHGPAGERVTRWLQTNGTSPVETRTIVDDRWEYVGWSEGGVARTHLLALVVDDGRPLAIRRFGVPHPDEPAGLELQYVLGDHLGSSRVVLDRTVVPVNREEYSAFGETSFGGFARKRFRFAGRERSDHSGLTFFPARPYLAWLGRWVAPDPTGLVDGPNLYAYATGNPVTLADPRGLDSAPAQTLGGNPDDEWIRWEDIPSVAARAPPPRDVEPPTLGDRFLSWLTDGIFQTGRAPRPLPPPPLVEADPDAGPRMRIMERMWRSGSADIPDYREPIAVPDEPDEPATPGATADEASPENPVTDALSAVLIGILLTPALYGMFILSLSLARARMPTPVQIAVGVGLTILLMTAMAYAVIKSLAADQRAERERTTQELHGIPDDTVWPSGSGWL